jgi:hypothetical protein
MLKDLKMVHGEKRHYVFTTINSGNRKESQFLKCKILRNQYIKTKRLRLSI